MGNPNPVGGAGVGNVVEKGGIYTTSKNKLYYMVFTANEKVWVYADTCDVINGCLVFYDIDYASGGRDEDAARIPIMSFSAGYWIYMYEAHAETGDSITEQIPFWKRHMKGVAQNRSGLA